MKTLRMRRLLRHGRGLFTPLDHGATLGPIAGIESIETTVRTLAETGRVDAVILHKGPLERCADVLTEYDHMSTILHLSGAPGFGPESGKKVLLSSVEDAVALGADGVSIHVNVGSRHTSAMMADLGRVSSACRKWGMPLLAMMYVEADGTQPVDIHAHRIAARIAAEAGADMVKIAHVGDVAELKTIIDGAGIPVLVSGGAAMDEQHRFIEQMAGALDAGASGFAVGRNVFQANDVAGTIESLHKMLHADHVVCTADFQSAGS